MSTQFLHRCIYYHIYLCSISFNMTSFGVVMMSSEDLYASSLAAVLIRAIKDPSCHNISNVTDPDSRVEPEFCLLMIND